MAKHTKVEETQEQHNLNLGDEVTKGELVQSNGTAGTTIVPTKPGTKHVTVYKPAEIETYEVDAADETAATEQQGSTRVPIFRVLQSNSPQVKDGHPMYVEGAKEGDFINTATGQIYSGKLGLYFIPAHTELKYPCYIKREEDGTGGGFIGVFEPGSPEVKQGMRDRMEEYGNLFGPLPFGLTEEGKEKQLIETYYIAGKYVVPNDDGTFPGEFGTMFSGSLAYSSSFIKEYKGWEERTKNLTYNVQRPSGKIDTIIPTLWTHVWHVKTILKTRGATVSWKIPRITLAEKDEKGVEVQDYKRSKLDRSDFLYKQTEDLRASILEGNVELDFEKDTAQPNEGGTSSNEDQHGGAGGINEEIPFPT